MPSPPGAEAPADAWVRELLGRARPHERTLVLCRTRSAASLVRRWAARQGGVLGLEAMVPAGLAVQVHRAEGVPDATVLPPSTTMGRRIGGRPGLSALAFRWMRELRTREALSLSPSAPAWLEELLGTPFGQDPEDEQVLALVDAARARGSELTASMRWDRVTTLGFAEEPAFLAPAEQAVALAMAGSLPPPGAMWTGPLPAVEVPDVIAEVRLAVAIAAQDPSGTLVLVASDSTGRRVRDALDRNGVGGAYRDPTPLGTHPVASAVRRAVSWFAEPSGIPSLAAVDLFFVLSRTSLGRRLHPAAMAWLGQEGDSDGEPERFDERSLARVLDSSRLREAPLARWLQRMQELAAHPDPRRDPADQARERRAARHLEVRLRVLDAVIRGLPLGEALGTTPSFDPDDFEDALRELLGDPPGPQVPPVGTLGAVARFLVELRVRVHDDPVARAILGALRERAQEPAGPARIHDVLSGPGLDPGVLPDGVDVLPLEEWDGRPCRTLVVLDVHDHGLARPQPPDPLLSDAECSALGVPTGGERLAHRLRTVLRAAAQAERVLLVVSRTDASGRDTVPPIDLPLVRVAADWPVGSYGAQLPLPELLRTTRLRVLSSGAPVEPAAATDPARDVLARGANLEWTLEGRHPMPALAPVVTPASLSTVLKATTPTMPVALRPWLGWVEGVPEGCLPEPGHAPDRPPPSVTGLLQPLARCAWQAFAAVVLRVKPRREPTDALDPRELGTAAHDALRRAARDLNFRHHDDDSAALAVTLLRAATDQAFEGLLQQFGGLSPSRTASADGLRDRWKQHFATWIAARRGWPPMRSWEVRNHPAVGAAEERFRALVPAGRELPAWMIRTWIVQHRSDPPDAFTHDRELRRVDDRNELPPSTSPDLPTFLADPSLGPVREALAEAYANRALVQGDAGTITHSYVAAEVPFGSSTEAPVPVHGLGDTTLGLPAARLRFGRSDLQLQGQIDRLDFLVSERGQTGFVVTDYKTSRMETTGDDFRRSQWALEDPQLLVYAMVVARAARDKLLPDGLTGGAAAVAHDRVRHTFREKEAARRIPESPDTWMPVDARLLRAAAQDLGYLVDNARDGRWPLRPHRHRCPKVSRGGFCDVAPGCRLRGLPDGTP